MEDKSDTEDQGSYLVLRNEEKVPNVAEMEKQFCSLAEKAKKDQAVRIFSPHS